MKETSEYTYVIPPYYPPVLPSLCSCVVLDMGSVVMGMGLTMLEVGLIKLEVGLTGCDVDVAALLVVGMIDTILSALPAVFTATTLMV